MSVDAIRERLWAGRSRARRYAAKPMVGLPSGAGDGSDDQMVDGRSFVIS